MDPPHKLNQPFSKTERLRLVELFRTFEVDINDKIIPLAIKYVFEVGGSILVGMS